MNAVKSKTSLLKKFFYTFGIFILFFLLLITLHQPILKKTGHWIVVDETPDQSEAAVVLCSGVEYYPRLMEAATLYNNDIINKIIINGNRKTDEIRELEDGGYKPCCPWYENSLRVLEIFGVPRDIVIPISLEDAYDTVSEARGVGEAVIHRGINQVVITTSKYHTRRARHIWHKLYEDRLNISMVAAKKDPYDPNNWWKDGRQIRWLMAEYGAWIYLAWKNIIE